MRVTPCVTQFTHGLGWSGAKGASIPFIAMNLLAGCAGDDTTLMVGTLERDRIELTVTHAEPIARHHVKEGDVVTAGTLLSEQTSTRLEAQQRRAEAERDQLEARLAELVRGPRREQIREAIARIDRLEALRREAEVQRRRLEDLRTKGFASAAALDEAVARHDSASASITEANAYLDSLVAGTTAEELAQARGGLRAAESRVAELVENLSRLRHIAPIDGLIEALPYEEGEIPPVGAPVVVMLRAGVPYARIYVPEPLRARLGPGDTLHVRLDGVESTYRGRVRFVASEASFTPYFALTRHDRSRLTYIAEVDLPDAQSLPAGIPLEAWLDSEPAR